MRFASRYVLCLILVCSAIGASRSVWNGVYSKEQAGRGQKAYNSQCARCLGDSLLGGESSPPPVDRDFLEKLGRRQCGDLVAYLLSASGFLPGGNVLESAAAVLDEILIQPKQ